jgi:hypothetical protein
VGKEYAKRLAGLLCGSGNPDEMVNIIVRWNKDSQFFFLCHIKPPFSLFSTIVEIKPDIARGFSPNSFPLG